MDNRGVAINAVQLMERGGFHEFPRLAFIPGPRASISLMIAFTGQSLKNWSTSFGVGAILPIENGGFPMLSSANVNARI